MPEEYIFRSTAEANASRHDANCNGECWWFDMPGRVAVPSTMVIQRTPSTEANANDDRFHSAIMLLPNQTTSGTRPLRPLRDYKPFTPQDDNTSLLAVDDAKDRQTTEYREQYKPW